MIIGASGNLRETGATRTGAVGAGIRANCAGGESSQTEHLRPRYMGPFFFKIIVLKVWTFLFYVSPFNR